jgi:hypothetical protein
MPIHLTGSFAVSGSVDAQSYTQNGQPLSSNPFPYTGSAIISGSLNVIGNLLQNGAAVNAFPFTGSALITGSLVVTGSVGFSAFLLGVGSWSSGGALSTTRYNLAGAGTQNAGLAFGGRIGGSYDITSCTQEYNGTSWTLGGDLITARHRLGGIGIQNAALAFGGNYPVASCTEEYNGSSWSSGGALISERYFLAGAGTQNAGLAFGGCTCVGFTRVSCTEEYDGTSWSSGGALSTARYAMAGMGTQNAGLAAGGGNPDVTSVTEEYNGSSWSSGGVLISSRRFLAGAGEQNTGLAFGGDRCPAIASCTEEYNGTSWSAGGGLITSRARLGGEGTQSSALAFGGNTPSVVSCTEEYNKVLVVTKTFDYSSTTGRTTVSCLIETSAERYKSNIQPLDSQLANVMQLQPVEFDWKSNQKHDMGFVADSVENIYPNLVSKNAQGEVEGMNYSKMISALVKSLQEQQIQIESLSSQLNNLSQ